MDHGGIREGMNVRSAEGDLLGKVRSCGEDTFVVEKSALLPKEYSARYDSARVRGGEVWLRTRRGDLLQGRMGEEGATQVAVDHARERGELPPPGAPPVVRTTPAEDEDEHDRRPPVPPNVGDQPW